MHNLKKEIPNNIEAEQSVLGAMLLSKYALEKAVETLTNESFFLDKHAKIFNALKNLQNKKVAVDITTLTTELKDENTLNEIGGVEYLSEILDNTPTAANIDHYIKIVEDKSILRNLIEEATGHENKLNYIEFTYLRNVNNCAYDYGYCSIC